MALSIVILAAGQGKRMKSKLPKVLHTIGGIPLLEHVIKTADNLNPDIPPIVIYGHQGSTVKNSLGHLKVIWVEQLQQLGTGHALLQALPYIPKDDRVLVLYGDVPFISKTTLKRFIQHTSLQAIGIITADFADPAGLGRIIRDNNDRIINIIEEKDLTEFERNITEINSGIYLFPAHFLQYALPKIQNNNAQKEYYLTDVIKMAEQKDMTIQSIHPEDANEVHGINDLIQLANLERVFQRQQAENLMRSGVTLRDPSRFDLRGELNCGQDVVIDINVIIEGKVTIGNHCIIGPNTILRNVTIGDHVEIKANSILEDSEVANGCHIGPFARLRPESILAPHSHIGNFVEIKKSKIGEGTKINHLSYIGDSEIGRDVNIGAGTITCNYDGVNKHRTIIGNNAFIGSNSSLVAPLTIAEYATIGAGSTITQHAPSHQLTLGRAKQISVEHWKRPTKKES